MMMMMMTIVALPAVLALPLGLLQGLQLVIQAFAVLVDTIKANANRKLNFSIWRGSASIVLGVVLDQALDGSGRIGVQLSANGKKPHRVKADNLGDVTVKATVEFSRLLSTVLDGLGQVFFNFAHTADKLSGPVAIVAVGAEVVQGADVTGLFQFAAIDVARREEATTRSQARDHFVRLQPPH